MLNVNTATKNAYLGDSTHKSLRVVFPELNLEYQNPDLVSQSLEIVESLSEGEIEFVGCIASQLSLTIRNLTGDVKGRRVNVFVSAANTTEIPLFNGYVYEVEQAAERRHKKIKAYDVLFNLSQINVADWYTSLSFPITLKGIRNSLFEYLEITEENANLPNDTLSIVRNYNPVSLAALDVIKSVCQINGVFGRINRYGHFEYLSPSSGATQNIAYYKSASYQEFTVKPADKVVVSYDDKEGVYGGGSNVYTIRNNIFSNGFEEEDLRIIAERIYNNISSFTYRPFESDINGLPFLECLDKVTMDVADLETDVKRTLTFTVLSRTIKGIQSLRDICRAEGDEYQHTFTSDLSIQIDELKRQMEVVRQNMDNLKFAHYLISNTEDIDISDNETKDLFDMWFAAKERSVVTFNCEILCDVDTTVEGNSFYDAIGRITYYFNNLEISGYYPTETWMDGKHILHLFYYFNIQTAGRIRFKATLNLNGGSVRIKAADLKGAIYGQNLVASDNWNGVLRVEEGAGRFNIPRISAFISAGDAVNTGIQYPVRIESADEARIAVLPRILYENAEDTVFATTHTDSRPIVTETDENIITETEETIYTEGD